MLRWIGHLQGIEGLHGIPARDLTDDEVEEYGGMTELVKTGLYEPVDPVPPKKQTRVSPGDKAQVSSDD